LNFALFSLYIISHLICFVKPFIKNIYLYLFLVLKPLFLILLYRFLFQIIPLSTLFCIRNNKGWALPILFNWSRTVVCRLYIISSVVC
jgi:hypothetical protein